MSGDDWQAGDLALCLKMGTWSIDGKGPKAGEVHTVIATVGGADDDLYLELASYPGSAFFRDLYWSARFRKIKPHQPDAEDAETIRLLNSAPVKEPAA